jgi:hypothetical protein
MILIPASRTYTTMAFPKKKWVYILRHPGEDRPGMDDSRHALGQTLAGRYLRAIYVPDSDADGVFVVTAYELRGKQLQAYRRRRRRKGRQ